MINVRFAAAVTDPCRNLVAIWTMMMTVGSALNVEPHYTKGIYQHTHHQPTATDTKSPSNATSCNMAYRFGPSGSLLSSSTYKHKLADSDEQLDTAHMITNQLGSFEGKSVC